MLHRGLKNGDKKFPQRLCVLNEIIDMKVLVKLLSGILMWAVVIKIDAGSREVTANVLPIKNWLALLSELYDSEKVREEGKTSKMKLYYESSLFPSNSLSVFGFYVEQ